MNYSEHLAEYGWVLIDLIDTVPVYKIRDIIANELKTSIGNPHPLDMYHRIEYSDEQHISNQTKLSKRFHDERPGKNIIGANLNLFSEFIGLNMKVQKKPYLRIARPHKRQDNIGYHRDTFYGGAPYELSVVIPYVDLDEGSTLQVMDQSHHMSEDEFPITQVTSDDVIKGSDKHKLGFLYAPKLMSEDLVEKMHAVPIKVGQALVFFLSTVHGCVENMSTHTRWSSDIRIMNSLAPVDLSARPEYYETLTETCVTQSAKAYELQNA